MNLKIDDESVKKSITLNEGNSLYHTINEEYVENSNTSTPSVTQNTTFQQNQEVVNLTPNDEINQMKENLVDNDEMEVDIFNDVEKPVFLTPMPNKNKGFNLFRNIFTDYKSKDTIQN